MQSQEYYLLEYALQEQDLHPVCCKGMTIQPPSAAIKSARILSAAITCTPLPPAGVRIGLPAGVRIEPPAGVRTPRDDLHSQVG